VWLQLLPDDDRARATPPTFRASYDDLCRDMTRPGVWIAGLLALTLAAPAAGGNDVVFGINDGRFTASWPKEMAELAPRQVGIWVAPEDVEKPWPAVPPSVGVLAQLVGNQWWADRPGAYAAAARRLVLSHPNVRELQVWNEPDLCWFPCAPQETAGDGVTRNRFYGPWLDRYLDLLSATSAALAGTGVKVLGFGMSPRLNGKWGPEALAAGIADWRNKRGGRYYEPRIGGRDPDGRWRSGVWIGRAWDGRLMDGFAYHAYAYWQPETTERIWNALGLPIWWTEAGMDTTGKAGEHGYFGEVLWLYGAEGDELQQAERLAAVVAAAKTDLHIAGVFNFLLHDEADLQRWQSGLLRPDGTRKPAFELWKAVAR
jgi:hypothetical protein